MNACCRSCGASVRWLVNKETGRAAPINAEPSLDGNIVIDGDRYHVVARGERLAGPFHKSHFVTCPQATTWKKGGR